MYRRRIFYDIITGEILRSYTAQGTISEPYTPEFEAAVIGLENWGVFSWEEYDPAVEAQFAQFDANGVQRIVSVHVDVSQQPHKLVFEYEAVTQE